MFNCGIFNLDIIEVFEMACDLLAVSVMDMIFVVFGDECYKFFWIYKVINWCEYDGESLFVLICCDEDCDEIFGDEDVWVFCCLDYVFVDWDNNYSNNILVVGMKGIVCNG